ncbi:MAG: HAMP domain-containing histidine kinase, partial [Candidatus Thermoplasmatota archaeon]|nr:HAMP domain-containing histidine kinase [Candidatus Thermoplasmatota archaeon]
IENVSAGLSKGNNFANTVMELLKLSYKRETVRENYSLYSVVSSAISNVRASMYPRKIELETDIDPRAAEITASKMVEQVFINLFTNSCKYNRNDVVKLVLRSYPVENGERRLVGVEIRDNGTGIDSSDPDAIFDRFNTAAKGTGLGLSLVRAIMRSADGDISIKETSTEGTGSGTTFVLTFVSPVSQIEKVIAK